MFRIWPKRWWLVWLLSSVLAAVTAWWLGFRTGRWWGEHILGFERESRELDIRRLLASDANTALRIDKLLWYCQPPYSNWYERQLELISGPVTEWEEQFFVRKCEPHFAEWAMSRHHDAAKAAHFVRVYTYFPPLVPLPTAVDVQMEDAESWYIGNLLLVMPDGNIQRLPDQQVQGDSDVPEGWSRLRKTIERLTVREWLVPKGTMMDVIVVARRPECRSIPAEVVASKLKIRVLDTSNSFDRGERLRQYFYGM